MDKKLRNDILKALKDIGYACEFNKLKDILINQYNHERVIENHLDIFSSKVLHILDVFVGEGLVYKQIGDTGGGRPGIFFSLTAEGYQKFDPWYKKSWGFFTNDMAKILSVIAIILSIIATIFSFFKK